MNAWIVRIPVALLAALLAAAAAFPATPGPVLGLAALLFAAATARAFGLGVALLALPVAATVVARPWREAGGALSVEPMFLAALPVFALAGLWIGGLERHLGTQRQVSKKAQFDPLTGLLNRTAFERIAGDAMLEANERNGMVAMLFIDLDRFKVVNDTYGHELGDAVLRRVADLLREHVRQADLVGRLGGDEFTVALRNLREKDSAASVARKLLKLLNEPQEVAGRRIEVGASIGIAMFPRDGQDVTELLKNADHAMYQIKDRGRNGISFSSHETQIRNDRRIEVERQLRGALHEDEFELHYQPKVDFRSGGLAGVEMLLRWRNRDLGLVSPDEFIPMAEETGMILPLGRWLLRQACFQLRDWDEAGVPPITLAVNVSTLQFRQPDFVHAVEEALRDSGIAPERLELEVTETVLMKEYTASLRQLERLAALGVGIALDDFGTGYSSLAYLQNLPIRTLKIDRSFVSGLTLRGGGEPGGTAPIVETILTLGQKLGKEVVAEGVETRAQARWLAQSGCTYGQGFLYARPQPASRIAKLLERAVPAPTRADVQGERLLMSGA